MRCNAMHTAGLAAAALCDRRHGTDGGEKIRNMTGGSECILIAKKAVLSVGTIGTYLPVMITCGVLVLMLSLRSGQLPIASILT